MWYIVHLSNYIEGDEDDFEVTPFFEGANYEQKYDSYRVMEEDEDPLYIKVVDKISSIVTIWYMSGVQNAKDIEEYLTDIDQHIEDDLGEDTDESSVLLEEA
jgi:hypothetical protein